MDNELNFKPQRNKVISKTNQKSGWVLHTFKSRFIDFMRIMWRSLIQPHLDYCSIIWAPVSNKGELLAMEGPLRSFTKKAWDTSHLNYWKRLQSFRLSSVQRRVQRYKILYIWKMRNGLVPDCGLVPSNTIGTRSCETYQTCSTKAKLPSVKTKLTDSLFCHGIKLYNCLPLPLREYNGTLNEFKIHLDRFLKKLPDQPEVPGLTPETVDIFGQPSNCIIDWVRILNPVCGLEKDLDIFYDFSVF